MKLAWWKVWSYSDYVLELREGELLITIKAHSIFGTHHKQMDCFWKASSHDTIPLSCLCDIHCTCHW